MKGEFQKSPDKLGRVFSGIAILISLGAVYFAWKQVDITEVTATRQIRAYVMTRTLPEVWAINGAPETYVFFRNAGQTPATELTLRGKIEVRKKPPRDRDFKNIPFIEINDALEPSEEIKAKKLITFERGLTPDEITSIKDGKAARFYVWGVVTYLDVFDRLHHTYFCYSFYGHFSYKDGVRAGNRSFCQHPKFD